MRLKNKLQNTHDELATVLMTLLNQTIGGNHAPMVYQLTTAVETLRKSIPNIQSDSPHRFKSGNIHELLDDFDRKLHKIPVDLVIE